MNSRPKDPKTARNKNVLVTEGYKNLTQEVMKLEKQREKSRAGLGR